MADTHVLEPRRVEKVEIRRTEVVAPLPRGTSLAFGLLYLTYIVAPLAAGLDKFFGWMVNWEQYLSPTVKSLLPVSSSTFMSGVGAVEIAAAVLVAVAPRLGGFVVAAWLWAIIANLLLIPGHYDIALRDLGLSLGALAMVFLAGDLKRRRAASVPPPA